MGADWINNLDVLASAGVIDYDAAADIRGIKPRYAGSPEFALKSPYNPQYRKTLSNDEFAGKDDRIINNPGWKKALFALIALGGIAYGGYKMKNKLTKSFVSFVKDKAPKAGKWAENILNKQTASSKVS